MTEVVIQKADEEEREYTTVVESWKEIVRITRDIAHELKQECEPNIDDVLEINIDE